MVFDITGSKISSTYEIAYDLQGGSVDSKINNPNNYKIIDDGDYFIGLKSNSNRIVSASNGGKKIRDTLEITAKDSPFLRLNVIRIHPIITFLTKEVEKQ